MSRCRFKMEVPLEPREFIVRDVNDSNRREEYDNIPLGRINASLRGIIREFAHSKLIRVVILNKRIAPDNVSATPLVVDQNDFRSGTKCSLVATLSFKGHRPVRSFPIEIYLRPGNIPLNPLPLYERTVMVDHDSDSQTPDQEQQVAAVNNPDYSVQLPLGGSLSPVASGLRIDGRVIDSVEYSVQGFSAGTTDFADASNQKSNVCTVETDVTSDDFGTIATDTAAAAGDICRLSVMGQSTGYDKVQASYNFIVTSGTITDSSTLTYNPNPPYSGQ